MINAIRIVLSLLSIVVTILGAYLLLHQHIWAGFGLLVVACVIAGLV